MEKDIKSPISSEETTNKTTPPVPSRLLEPADSSNSGNDVAREQWRNTRDLLQKALSDWDQSEKTAEQDLVQSTGDQKMEKERLEALLGLLKEKMDELSED